MHDELPVYQTVCAWVAGLAEENIGFRSFIREYSRSGAIGETTMYNDWLANDLVIFLFLQRRRLPDDDHKERR